MANVTQTVNVLQALFLTKDEKMILTPTYHVFDLYQVHQDATLLPFRLQTEEYEHNGQKVPMLNVSCSKAPDGSINMSIVNVHPDKDIAVECEIRGASPKRVSGRILTAPELKAHNTFERPHNVKIADFKKASLQNGMLKFKLPAKSIVVLNVK